MGVWLVIERSDLDVAGRSIKADCLDEGPVRFEVDGRGPVTRGVRLELGQDSTSDAEAARRLGDPHALELYRLTAVELERPAADWLLAKRGHQEQAGWRTHLRLVGGDAPHGIEARVESAVELGEVCVQAMLRMWVRGIDRADLDHRRGQAPLHVIAATRRIRPSWRQRKARRAASIARSMAAEGLLRASP